MWAVLRKEHRFAAGAFLLLLETESADVLQAYFLLSARGKVLFLASLLGLQVDGFSFCLLLFVFVPRFLFLWASSLSWIWLWRTWAWSWDKWSLRTCNQTWDQEEELINRNQPYLNKAKRPKTETQHLNLVDFGLLTLTFGFEDSCNELSPRFFIGVLSISNKRR